MVVDGIVYYPSNTGTDSLYALDAATGELIWKYMVGDTDDAVTVRDGYLYTASDSLWCLDALTGDRIWATARANISGSTPAVSDGFVYGGRVLGGSGLDPDTSQVVCLDALIGSVSWESRLPVGPAMVSCMTIWNGLLFVPTWQWEGTAYLFALDASTGDIVWLNDDAWEGYWDSSPVLVDSTVYISGWDGKCRGIDALTGMTVWEREISACNCISATPAYHDSRLYFADQLGAYHCLDAEYGEPVWEVPGTQHGSSGVAAGMVFYGEYLNPDGARVIALDCETGEQVWAYSTGSDFIASSPAITDGVVYIAATDWNLYAFGTGLKYTYRDDLFAEVGPNELIVGAYDGGSAIAADAVNFVVTGTGLELDPSPRLALAAAPNPFYSVTTICFKLQKPGRTSVRVYDLTGRCLRTLTDSATEAGEHTVVWNGRDAAGAPVPSGLYICRIRTGPVSETTGLCLLR